MFEELEIIFEFAVTTEFAVMNTSLKKYPQKSDL